MLPLISGFHLFADDFSDLMPRSADFTSMWWKEGFPSVVEGAPWERCITTGHYQFVLNTETLEIPHLGPAQIPIDDLPSAKLNLQITVDGTIYRCTAGGPWSRYGGPRLVESGRWFQRGDVTNLVLKAEDGRHLNAKTRFETAAWPDQLSLRFAAQPGKLPIQPGEASFGRVRGGFGLDANHQFVIAAESAPDAPQFTMEFWAFVPNDYSVTNTMPWLLCKNHHEQANGNYGIVIHRGGLPQACLNLGGGRDNIFRSKVEARNRLKMGEWNHLALSYDGKMLVLYGNGRILSETPIGKARNPVPGAIAFGRRLDNSGDGYRFQGIVDEIRF
ncbi:MAG: LamG-like jellyroll fold domain-containing protein, partial [Verrucomicrobiota bacterium]